jgi:alcohol dehydrogenase class IV
VILDGELTASLPPGVTATTGVDALAHALECFLSNKANELSDLLALKAARTIHVHLAQAFEKPSDIEARQSMLNAAFYAGMCISLSGTTAVHALSYPLGARFHVPHGQANAMLLPAVMRFNASALPDRTLALADAFDVPSDGTFEEQADGFVQELENLLNRLRIPRSLQEFGVASDDIPGLVEVAYGIRRLMDNNPREMSKEEMALIYEGVL